MHTAYSKEANIIDWLKLISKSLNGQKNHYLLGEKVKRNIISDFDQESLEKCKKIRFYSMQVQKNRENFA